MVATRDFVWEVRPSRDVTWTQNTIRAALTFYAEDPGMLSWSVGNPAADGVFVVTMRVRGRDRHWAGQLAQNVMRAVLIRTRAKGSVRSVRLPPHTNRGYAAGRARPRRVQGAGADPGGLV